MLPEQTFQNLQLLKAIKRFGYYWQSRGAKFEIPAGQGSTKVNYFFAGIVDLISIAEPSQMSTGAIFQTDYSGKSLLHLRVSAGRST